MKTPVKVSVIMLACNVGRYVETAIKGVLAQKTTYPIELILSEDCSTDNTLEICERYAALHPDTIRLIRHEQNLGLQKNFIDAHRHCTGEYIAICDGDDYWINRFKLQRMTDFMDAHPDFAICFHRVINYYEEDGSKSFSNGGQAVVTNITHLAQSNYITNSSSLFRRAYVQELPEWFALTPLCDYAMHMVNAQYGNIYYFKTPMAVYRKHKQGIWSVENIEKRQERSLYARELLLEYFKENEVVYNNLRRAFCYIAFVLVRHYREQGDEAKIKAVLERLLVHHPEMTLEEMEAFERKVAKQASQFSPSKALHAFISGMRGGLSKLFPLPRP